MRNFISLLTLALLSMSCCSSCSNQDNEFNWVRTTDPALDDDGVVEPPEWSDINTEPPKGVTCPDYMVWIEGGTFELGEWAQCNELGLDNGSHCQFGGMVTLHQNTIDSFCVQKFPFPGIEGVMWPPQAPNLSELITIDTVILPAFNRRLCTMSELLLAATGPDNWRYPYDRAHRDESETICDNDDHHNGHADTDEPTPIEPIGSREECVSRYDVHDTQVNPTWARYDDTMRSVLHPVGDPAYLPGHEIEGVIDYALISGAVRTNTFYVGTNFGVHTHGPGENWWANDDDLRICADPGVLDPDVEAAYQEAIALFLGVNRRYTNWVSEIELAP